MTNNIDNKSIPDDGARDDQATPAANKNGKNDDGNLGQTKDLPVWNYQVSVTERYFARRNAR
jgi:hypothetical protein